MNIATRAAKYVALTGCLLLPATGMSATLDEIDQRLKKLENEVSISREETDDLESRFRNNMSVTGYADVEYITTNENGKDDGFRIHHLSMFLKKQINEKWRFFSEIEYEDGPFYEPSKATDLSAFPDPASSVPDAKTVGSGKIFAEAVNFDFQWRPDTSLRAGRFFTPAGLWSVDHYPPFVSTQERPQHIRQIFPQLVDGAAISGNHAVGNAFVNYDLFIGNGETKRFDGGKDSNSTKAAGLRFAVSLPIAQQFELGATLYRDKLASSAAEANMPEKDAKGFHAKVRIGAFGYQAEYADGSYTPTVSPGTNLPYHRRGLYHQFSYDVSNWTLGYRYDYYEPSSIIKTPKKNEVKRINSVFANYHVDKNIVLKLEHHLVDQEDPTKQDYYKNLASIVVNLD